MIVLAVFASVGLLVIVVGGFVATRFEIPLFMRRGGERAGAARENEKAAGLGR